MLQAALIEGMKPSNYQKLKEWAANPAYDRLCGEDEHDPYSWHPLIRVGRDSNGDFVELADADKCHYNHQHGDDPSFVNDVFGEPGEWFERPGQSISYPWQTFKTTVNDLPTVQMKVPTDAENNLKHEAYFWVVRRNQGELGNCRGQDSGNRKGCVTDYRLQVHGMFFGHGAGTRWHSASLEARFCEDYRDPGSCGIFRTGGWFDYGRIITQPLDANPQCDTNNKNNVAHPNDNKFFPIFEFDPGDPSSNSNNNEFRCHPRIEGRLAANGAPNANIADTRPTRTFLAQWWAHNHVLEVNFHLKSVDPIGNALIGDQFVKDHYFCPPDETGMKARTPQCRYNQSIMTNTMEYRNSIYEYMEALDGNHVKTYDGSNARGTTNIRLGEYFRDRFGRVNHRCTEIGLDCVPVEINGIRLFSHTGQQSPKRRSLPGRENYGWQRSVYQQNRCLDNCEYMDYDITPKDRPSWITWFYRMAANAPDGFPHYGEVNEHAGSAPTEVEGAPVVVENNGMVIQNGDFSGSVDPWGLYHNGSSEEVPAFVTLADDGSRGGVLTLVLRGSKTPVDIGQDRVTVQAGQEYRLTLDLKGINVEKVGLHLHAPGRNGNNIGLHDYFLPVAAENIWQSHEVIFTATESTDQAWFGIRADNTVTGQLFVDNVQFMALTDNQPETGGQEESPEQETDIPVQSDEEVDEAVDLESGDTSQSDSNQSNETSEEEAAAVDAGQDIEAEPAFSENRLQYILQKRKKWRECKNVCLSIRGAEKIGCLRSCLQQRHGDE